MANFASHYRKGALVTPTYESRKYYSPIARWNILLKESDIIAPPPIKDSRLEYHFKSLRPKAHPNFAVCREIDGIICQKTLAVVKPYVYADNGMVVLAN